MKLPHHLLLPPIRPNNEDNNDFHFPSTEVAASSPSSPLRGPGLWFSVKLNTPSPPSVLLPDGRNFRFALLGSDSLSIDIDDGCK
ncbi:unnamed protein product [Linum trigynum]|uniref:Uncharacterized protein n=1 Tax=Linum trigynum TaxID=586398 RepID=A0AAV2D6T6_9ROSI